MRTFKQVLFIFHRDLRLEDNTALIEALSSSESVIPCFIFDSRQLDNNPYQANNCVQFMLEALADLDASLKKRSARLYYFEGITHTVVEQLVQTMSIDAVFSHYDYTPFSLNRDLNLKHVCEKNNVVFIQKHDYLLNEPSVVRKNDGGVYTVYTPFMKKSKGIDVNRPQKNNYTNYYTKKITNTVLLKDIRRRYITKTNQHIVGGRAEGLKLLKRINQLTDYDEKRNLPAVTGTSRLSAHNKFGTLSIREVYHAIAKIFSSEHTLINELYWRDFFIYVGFHHPHVLGGAFYEKYDNIEWSKSKKSFQAWCEGRTGFPIVDAGMRELNETGFMHNRVRMITASFLVKDLHIDWHWGEKYFAQLLVDYDPLVNNGNWQWAASTGCDAQPYFRIFNPWRQQQRFDPDCVYIKQWIPELKDLSAKNIHALEKDNNLFSVDYPRPIVGHKTAAEQAKALFKKI